MTQILHKFGGMEAKKKSKHYSRRKGHNAEREFARKFREDLGFEFCKTSREASRLLDACGIDLSGLPLNIQIKAGYKQARPKPDRLFMDMKESLLKNFQKSDPVHTYPKIVIHKLDGQHPENQMVTMMWDDWIKFLQAYKKINDL